MRVGVIVDKEHEQRWVVDEGESLARSDTRLSSLNNRRERRRENSVAKGRELYQGKVFKSTMKTIYPRFFLVTNSHSLFRPCRRGSREDISQEVEFALSVKPCFASPDIS